MSWVYGLKSKFAHTNIYNGNEIITAQLTPSVTTRTIVQVFWRCFLSNCNSREFESLVVQLYW